MAMVGFMVVLMWFFGFVAVIAQPVVLVIVLVYVVRLARVVERLAARQEPPR